MQALAGSAQGTSEVAQCRCTFMHILNVKRQLVAEVIFQMTDHLITRTANRKKNLKIKDTIEKECNLNTNHFLNTFQSLENITCMCSTLETCPEKGYEELVLLMQLGLRQC